MTERLDIVAIHHRHLHPCPALVLRRDDPRHLGDKLRGRRRRRAQQIFRRVASSRSYPPDAAVGLRG